MSNSETRDGGLKALGVNAGRVNLNWNEARLYEEAVRRGEGEVAEGGPLVVKTGAHTGRSAKDKFTVRDAETENQVWWETNASITPEQFDTLWQDFKAHMDGKDVFVHISEVQRSGLKGLNDGQAISYELKVDEQRGKSSAVNLQVEE